MNLAELGRGPISAISPCAGGIAPTATAYLGENAVTDTATGPLPASVLEALGRYDTPTICNAMEIVAPDRRLIGYTTKPLVCPFPDLPPMGGYARKVTNPHVGKSDLAA